MGKATKTAQTVAAKAAAGAEASDEAQPTPPTGGRPQYVACWRLRRDGKRHAADADLPALGEAEAQSLLALGAIRLK